MDQFWNYYNNVTKKRNIQYERQLNNALYHAGVKKYTTSSWVKVNQAQIIKDMKMHLLTNNVPTGVVTSITTQFKKWLNSMH